MARRSHRSRGTELAGAYRGFDVIGEIIVVKIPPQLRERERTIGEALLLANPRCRLVLKVAGQTTEESRTRRLSRIAGTGSSTTEHKESGATFVVDLSRVFFTPRLYHERSRISRQVRDGERVLNMFSGVGSFSILIALRCGAIVFSLDKNPAAVECMRLGIRRNELEGRVLPILGDSRRLCQSVHGMDRVILPLPAISDEVIGSALETLGESGILHDYREVRGRRRECASKSETELRELLAPKAPAWEIDFTSSRPVRSVGRLRWHVSHDIHCRRL